MQKIEAEKIDVNSTKRSGVKSFVSRLVAFNKSKSIFQSKLSWKISLNVFLTLLVIQSVTLFMTKNNFQEARLHELETQARSAIVPLMNIHSIEGFASPLSNSDALRLTSTTNIRGLEIYNSDFISIASFGEKAEISLTNYQDLNRYILADGVFETVFTSEKLGFQYMMVVRVDAHHVKQEIRDFVSQSLFVMILLSGLVTTVLMITLGFSLLEPLIFLQRNLLRAQANPEKPDLEPSPFSTRDEIGSAIDAAQTLIYQNANNIKRIQKSAKSKIDKLAYFDTLTGLPNRTQFIRSVNDKIETLGPSGSKRFALIAIDLDHFKDINDSMGHKVGDEILKSIGQRLSNALPPSAVVARNGEDEFAVYTNLVEGGPSAEDIAIRLSSAIKDTPFTIYDENFQIRVSVGYAIYPDHAIDPDQVLKNADIALNRAKEEGRDTIRSYTKDFDKAVQERFQMLRDLRVALEEEQLLLHYQPQFDLKSGEIIGTEALIRWWKPDNSKEGGCYIPPFEFVPVAENSGLIVPVGEWVLRRACEMAVDLHKRGHTQMRMAVNVSAMQFMQEDFIDMVQSVLDETGLDPKKLELEVTETVFVADIKQTIDILKKLNALGIELAIDDFGTGYSSLAYLRQFPIDRLKIDQSFIRNALNNSDDAAITKTIIALGHSLNLQVIAEGVETRDHEDFLMHEGCDEVQGYRYSKPISQSDLLSFIDAYDGDLSIFDEPFNT